MVPRPPGTGPRLTMVRGAHTGRRQTPTNHRPAMDLHPTTVRGSAMVPRPTKECYRAAMSCRIDHRIQFRMQHRRYARRVISSGDAVPGAVDGGESAIRRFMPDVTMATDHRPAQAITVRIEVIPNAATQADHAAAKTHVGVVAASLNK